MKFKFLFVLLAFANQAYSGDSFDLLAEVCPSHGLDNLRLLAKVCSNSDRYSETAHLVPDPFDPDKYINTSGLDLKECGIKDYLGTSQ